MHKTSLIHDLKFFLEESRILSALSERIAYSRDMSMHSAIPDAVVLPRTREEVRQVILLAQDKGISVTPRGAGTSVTGAVIPIKGGIVMDLSTMNAIREINYADRYAVVEPGVICARLNTALAPDFFFPPDPGSRNIATIGGMISTNASGRRAVKYGTTRTYLLALEAVLASGEIIQTGHRTSKSSTGFDITSLFASAEGTMGIITEAVIRFLPCPETVGVCLAGFSTIEKAAETAVDIVTLIQSLSSCELMDCVSIQEFSKGTGYSFDNVNGVLILEVDGGDSEVRRQLKAIEDICRQHDAIRTFVVSDKNAQETIWRYRHKLISALNTCSPGSRLIPMAEDIGVPISKVPEAIAETKRLADLNNIQIILFGHAGDGNIHATFVIDPLNKEQWERACILAQNLNDMAVRLGGTISAEHGIGITKAPYIEQDLGQSHTIMKRMKQLLDPNDIMNPGKLGFSRTPITFFDHFAFNISACNAIKDAQTPAAASMLCMMCGSCRLACPVFCITGKESDNARSKVRLAYALDTGEIGLSNELANIFYHCTKCRSCERGCPAGIKVTDLIHQTREKLFQQGFLPPELSKTLAKIKHRGTRSPITAASDQSGLWQDKIPSASAADVLIFPGCEAGSNSSWHKALCKIMNDAGVSYAITSHENLCCGLFLRQVGDTEAFAQHAAQIAARIQQFQANILLTPCPGCLTAFSDYYPQAAPGWHQPVLSVPEYLESLIRSGRIKPRSGQERKIIYHDPCYLSKHRGVILEPRSILRSIPGISLIEFPKNRDKSLCCGGGSGLLQAFPQTAEKMADTRMAQAAAAKADIIATACPLCQKMFRSAAARLGKDAPNVMDLVEILQL